jgi:hypothetical protein
MVEYFPAYSTVFIITTTVYSVLEFRNYKGIDYTKGLFSSWSNVWLFVIRSELLKMRTSSLSLIELAETFKGAEKFIYTVMLFAVMFITLKVV